MDECLVIRFLGRFSERGWARLGRGDLWLHPLTQPLVPLPPGSQVQRGECTAVDKVPRECVGPEDVVLRHGGDARVVTDDAW